MSFLDIIRNLFNNNKKTAKIETANFEKTFGTKDAFQLILKEGNTPLANKDVKIEINHVEYTRKTNEEGVATLNINLPCGKYTATIAFEDDEYNRVTAYSKVTVNPVISTQDLTMFEKDGSQFIAIVSSATGVRLEGVPITFKINGVEYERTTGVNGEAKLNIRLAQGEYPISTSYNTVLKENTIFIKEKPKLSTRMEGTNMSKAYSEPTQYQCAVYDPNGRVGGTVAITINGQTYNVSNNSEGLYKLNIKLNPGRYQLTAVYKGDDNHLGSQIVNTIEIVEDPKKTVYNPVVWQRQPNSYTCGPTSLSMCSQILGDPTSISAFSNACYTTSNGTSPSNLIAGARKLGFKVTAIGRSYSVVKQAIDAGKPVIAHVMTRTMSCLGWQGNYGHYVVIYDYGDGYYHVADPTKGIAWCWKSQVDGATIGYEGIQYYSVERI